VSTSTRSQPKLAPQPLKQIASNVLPNAGALKEHGLEVQEDRDLIAECALFDRLHADWSAVFDLYPEDDQAAIDKATEPFSQAMDQSVGRMVGFRARTWAGISARFRSLWIDDESFRNSAAEPFDEHAFNERMNRALNRDMASLLGLLDGEASGTAPQPSAVSAESLFSDLLRLWDALDNIQQRSLGLRDTGQARSIKAAEISEQRILDRIWALEAMVLAAPTVTLKDGIAQMLLTHSKVTDILGDCEDEAAKPAQAMMRSNLRAVGLLGRAVGFDFSILGQKYLVSDEVPILSGETE
jgi:hypothetical protein